MNPFTFSTGNVSSNTKLTGIELSNNGGEISVNGTTKPMELWVENNPMTQPPDNVTMSVSKDGLNQTSWHSTEIKNTSFRVQLTPKEGSRPKFFLIFGTKEKRPTMEKNLYKVQMPDNR